MLRLIASAGRGVLLTTAVREARLAVSDLNRFFHASLCGLRMDLPHLSLAVQNDAGVVELRQSDSGNRSNDTAGTSEASSMSIPLAPFIGT